MPPGRAPPLRPGPQQARDGRGHPASRRGSPVGGPAMVRGLGRGMQASPAPECDLRVCPRAWAPQVMRGVKSPPVNSGDIRDAGLIPGSGRSPEKERAAHSSTLTGKSHGQRSLAGYSPWSRRESDTAWHAPPPKAAAASAGQGAAPRWGAQGHCSCLVTSEGVQLPMLGDPPGGATSYPTGQEKPVPRRCPSARGERGGVVTMQCRPWGTWPSVSLPAGDTPRTCR